MQKRALPSTSSGQPSQPKKPCLVAINQERSGSERNLVPSSYLTVEDVQRVVRKEVECAISQWAENFQSFIGDALKDIAQRVCSTENAVQKLVRKEVECAISQWAENFQSIGDALKDIAKRGRSTENAVQKLTEAVELANIHSPHLARECTAIAKSTAKNDARTLQLQLQTKLSVPLFTGKKLEGEGGARIKVALIDADTGYVVASGPEASIKLDVIVLEGDFNKDDEENWTQEEFENYVVKQREGKRPLLTGKLHVTLKEGVGELGDLIFTDNSSWNRSKSFRIGLKVASSYGGNTRIREAKTDAFPVKEHRGEAYKKHYPPASDDEVWRLKNIAKDGSFHKRLNEAGIHKVDEFLQQLSMDSEKLRNILGMTEKNWKPLLVHANTSTPNGKLYVYNHDNESDRGVIFNNFAQLSGLTADGVYCAADSFSLQQKVHADRLVKKAYENWNDVRQFNAEASSSSMLEKISCSPCEVLRDQQCFHPVHNNMHLPRLASHVGLKVPPRTSASTAEGNSGIPAAPLAIQSQSLNSQEATWKSIIDSLNLMEPSADTNVQPSGSFPGNSGITAAGLPMQLQSLNSQNTTWNQIIDNSNQKEPSADINVQPFGQPCGPPSSILASNIEDDDIDLFWRD